MGAWGTGSYDNDSVMDAVDGCVDADYPTQEEADIILDEAFITEADNEEMYYHVLGCVVYFLVHDCDVKREYLQQCVDIFIPYELENNNYYVPQERVESLTSEREMILMRLKK